MNYHKYFCDFCGKQVQSNIYLGALTLKYEKDQSDGRRYHSYEICFTCADELKSKKKSNEERQKDCSHDISSTTDNNNRLEIRCEKCRFIFDNIYLKEIKGV